MQFKNLGKVMISMNKKQKEIFETAKELSMVMREFQKNSVFHLGITYAQFTILDHLVHEKEIVMSFMGKLLNVEKSTVTRVLQPLVEKELIKKVKSEDDARVTILKLTKQGQMVYEQLVLHVNRNIDRLNELLPDEARNKMMQGLNIFIQAMRHCC